MSAAPWFLLSPFLSKPFLPLLSPPALGFGVGKLPQLSASSPRLPLAMPPRYNDAVNQEAIASVVTSEDERYGKKQVISLTPQLYDYILANVREPRVLRELREETSAMPGCQMLVSPEQAQLLTMLVQIMGAKNCIEIGVYTGYSSLAVALALPNSGHLVACERDLKRLEIAKKYYNRACVSHKVEIKHGLAYDTLVNLIERGKSCSFDFAFVDADKKKYGEYYELLLQLVRPGGLIIFDNVLWHGKVSDPQVNDLKTISLRNFNKRILEDMRVSISMVPIGDGMTICRKREADQSP